MVVTAGERRIVSVLVADVAGSTSIAEHLGPERSKYLFDDVVRLMREEVERFGGTVAQLTGDGVLALFGAPDAHEDDSERAVRAAVAVRGSLARYGAEVASGYGIELGVRVAVNTGPVVIPHADAPRDVLFNALGDTVNVAARLQALGDVVVGPATARQVESVFELEPLGNVVLKGRKEPVGAFLVVGARDRPAFRTESPFVGRRVESAALAEVFERLLEGTGAIVSITGEPGIGKSRLVAEATSRIRERSRILAGHAVAYAASIPYWPVRELLRGWLGIGISDPEARVRLELRAELARVLPSEADEAYPFLATLLGLSLDREHEQLMRDYARDSVQHQTFGWLFRLVSSLAAERPLCIVLEDLHWSDESTLSLVEDMLPAVEQAAVTFVLVHRSDPDHLAWHTVDRARRRYRRRFLELELEPLPVEDARAIAEADAGAALHDDLARMLSERAGGNPYFVGEAVRDLRERGALDRTGGRVTLIGEASIPGALQEALQARLARLAPDARELLSTAAVIGRSFGLPLLEQVLPSARLLPTLSELQWLQLVVQERSTPAPEYRFRHGLVQEVAYASLLDTHRRELHRLVGEAMEKLNRESPAAVYGLLGRHFAAADEPARAAKYLLKAGDAARAVDAQGEAIEQYRRALGFLERTGDQAGARSTLLKIALTHHLAFDFRAANDAFEEAFARPAPAPVRLEPTERITAGLAAAGLGTVTPGHKSSPQAWEVGRNLYRGLVSEGRDFEIEPDLAERFSLSDDGRTYRFSLRPDATWSDGTPVTAADFASTYRWMLEEGVDTGFWLDGVKAIAVDDRTLEIRLREPRAYFLSVLSRPPMFAWPRHVRERDGPGWHRAASLVGNGPFVLTVRDDDRMELVSSSTWWGARGNVRNVTIEQVSSPDRCADQWRDGHFDVLDEVVARVRVVADDRTVVQRAPGAFTWYLGFHARRAPVDDARVRRAFGHAIDRRPPAESVRSVPASTGGLVPPTVPGHSERIAPAFDPAEARSLLAEAGDASRDVTLAYLDLWEAAAAIIAAQLEAVGVRVHLLRTSSDDDLQAAIEDEAHAFLWAWGADFLDPHGILGTIRGSSPMLYIDDPLDAMLARAASLQDRGERLRTYREFERVWIGEQAAVVPIAYGDSLVWRRPWISGIWGNALGRSTFADAVVEPRN